MANAFRLILPGPNAEKIDMAKGFFLVILAVSQIAWGARVVKVNQGPPFHLIIDNSLEPRFAALSSAGWRLRKIMGTDSSIEFSNLDYGAGPNDFRERREYRGQFVSLVRHIGTSQFAARHMHERGHI